jgi:uncharacterized protein (TIGR03437 family)
VKFGGNVQKADSRFTYMTNSGQKSQVAPIFLHPFGVLIFCLVFLLSHPLFAQTQVTWTFAGPSGSTDRIIALATDPRTDLIVYAAAPGGGIWRSLDAGLTWTPIFDSQPSLQVCSIAIDPRFPDVIYAGTGDDQSPRPAEGVTRSNDGGRTWGPSVRITNRAVCALAIDPSNPARILAGSQEGLFVSSNSGTSWTRVITSPITSVAFDGPDVVYAGILADESPGARTHVFTRSSDGGRTWTDLPLPLNPTTPAAATDWVTVLASGSEVFVAVAHESAPLSQVDFFRSTDGGNHWSATFDVGAASPPMALLTEPGGNLYLAGTNLLLSADRGFTWNTVPTKSSQFHTAVLTAGTLLLAGEKGFESVGIGGVAREVGALPVAQILGLSIDTAGRIWAGAPSGLFGLVPLSDIVKTGVSGVGAIGRLAITAATNGTTTIFAAGSQQVYVATNNGAAASSHTVIADGELRAPYPPFVLDPLVSTTAYVAGRRVYRSTNSGTAWTALSIVDPDVTRVVTALAMPPSSRTTLFAVTACLPEVTLTSCPPISVIWRSTNAGQNWTQMSVVAGFVNQLAIDPRQPTRVYAAIGAFPAGPSVPAGLTTGDLLLSTTAGMSWTSLIGNLPHTAFNAVLIDPASLPTQFTLPAQTVYVGTDVGVFVSFDAGTRWTDISSGLPATPITTLALLQPDGVLAAGTFGRGVYRASVLGLAPGLVIQPLLQEVTLMQGATAITGIALNNVSSINTVTWQLKAVDGWLGATQPSGSVRPLGSSQVPIAVSATDLRAGIYVGRLQLQTSLGLQNVSVEAHVISAPAQITIVSGNNGAGLPNTPLPPLQVLVSDETATPLAGIPVAFTIVSGGGALNVRTAMTSSSGTAAAILTLPPKPATVQVLAASGAASVMFTVNAIAAPILLTDSVFDAVTFNSSASFGPGSILAISGQNLASEAATAETPLPTSLVTTRVLLATPTEDVALPLFSVSPLQITALMPFNIPAGRYLLHTEVGSVRSNDVEISIAAFAPGIFTVNGSGRGPGVFVKDDGSIVTTSNPADRGSRVSFYAAGLGAVNPPVTAGEAGASREPLNRTTQAPRVFFDRFSATVLYSGLAPGLAGRYLVTIQVPASVSPATNVSVSLTIGGSTSNRVTIPVR